MDQEKSSKKILKATLEAVFQSQEKIRKHLDILYEENRPLKDDNERDLFFRELTYSTLGLGIDFLIFFPVPGGGYVGLRKDLETVSRWLAYQQGKMVYVPMELYQRNRLPYETEVEIKYLWGMLRDKIFSIFPLAVDRATSLSKEQEEQGKSKGYQIDND